MEGIHYGSSCESSGQTYLDKGALKRLIFSSLVCLCFMLGQVIGGIFSNSLAIATDAVHLLVDVIGFFVGIVSVCLATGKPNSRLNFGWHRTEVIGAILSVMLIWIVTIFLDGLAVMRIMSGQYEIDCKIMLITAAVGFVMNVIMMTILHSGSHHHHHHHHHHQHLQAHLSSPLGIINGQDPFGITIPQPDSNHALQHDLSNSDHLETSPLLDGVSGNISCYGDKTPPPAPHLPEVSVPTGTMNINVRAAFIHALGDLVQSIGVIVAALVIYFKPEYKIADPICTFFFSFLVLCTTIQILKDAIVILMEGCPKHINQNDIRQRLAGIRGVKSVHNLRVWTLKMDRIVATVHLVLENRVEQHQPDDNDKVLKEARKIFTDLFLIGDVTIQLEEYEG